MLQNEISGFLSLIEYSLFGLYGQGDWKNWSVKIFLTSSIKIVSLLLYGITKGKVNLEGKIWSNPALRTCPIYLVTKTITFMNCSQTMCHELYYFYKSYLKSILQVPSHQFMLMILLR